MKGTLSFWGEFGEMLKRWFIIAMVMLLPFAAAKAMAEDMTPAVVSLPGLNLKLYSEASRDAEIVDTIMPSEFPPTVLYIDTSSNGMHKIRLQNYEKPVWVKSTRVTLPKIDRKVEIACESTAVAKTGQSGKGLGDRSTCKKN
ncbi:hypothetical protein [Sneathiella chungangensis]